MYSHRAVAYLIAVVSIFCAVNPSGAAHAGTTAGTLSIASPTYGVAENAGVEGIIVVRSGGSAGAATVLCRTSNYTAVAGQQYTAVSTKLTWASGDASPKRCSVPISTANPFAAQLKFYVELSGASGASLGSPVKTTVTIYGSAGAGTVSVSAPTFTVAQNVGAVTIKVNRTGGSAGAASVWYATANKTAIAGTDYTSERGVLRWANGESTAKTFSIPISNAKPFSGTKTLALALAGAAGVVLGSTSSAIVTIDGDAAATAGAATLSWSRPTTNTDGSPLTNLAGYKIRYGRSSTAMTSILQVSNPATLQYEISNLSGGTWYFAIASYTAAAVESDLSAIASKTI
jgi:hypothetical protein